VASLHNTASEFGARELNQSESKLGFNGAWSMAVGGMVGGGIFSTLGVVIGIAGAWTWLSFVAAGLVALAAGYSYVKLSGTKRPRRPDAW